MRIFVPLLLVVFLAAAAGAQDQKPFEDELVRVRKLVAGGSWKRGRKLLERLLETHARQPVALAHATEIRDVMKQCRFREKHGVPKAKDLVRGQLISYNRVTGRVRIRYTSTGNDDFLKRDRISFHRARFKGPHRISWERGISTRVATQVFVCLEKTHAYHLVLVKPRISRMTEAGFSLITEGAFPKFSAKTAFHVRVNRRNVQIFAGSRKIAEAKKPADLWGHIGFVPPTPEFVIEGNAEPSWIQGLVDAVDSKRLAAFDRVYDPRRHLPEWLFRRATADTTLAKPDGRALPAKPTTAESGLLVKIRAAMDEGRPARAVRLARAQPRRSALVEMLLARALEEEGEAAEALAVIKRVRAADPAYVPAEEARARLLRRLGREDEAFEAYRDIAERYPGGAELQARAASFFVGLGRRDEARELLATALANGLRSRALDAANRTLIRALNGPPWAKRHTYTSRHYLVVSNIDRTTAEKAARLLERAYAKYQSTLDRVDDKNRRRFRVFLFRGQRGFLEFSERTWGRTHSRHTAGFYNLGLKDLFIWNLPQREKMFGTILHEGFHQYLDRIMEGVPLWFNEGLAEYYSVAEKSGADKVALLRRVGTSPLSAWLRLDNAAFMAGAQKNYLQAWALLAFLRTTTPEREALFRKFWRAFRKHPTRRAGLAAALEGVDVAALDREFRAWLRTG